MTLICLKVCADSDYGSDQSRRSTLGMIAMLNGGLIAWASVLGKTISTSSCEAEINAATFTAKEIVTYIAYAYQLT
jgi:ATP-dependent Zn protease